MTLRIGDSPAVRTDDEGRFAVPRVDRGPQRVNVGLDDGSIAIATVDPSAADGGRLDLHVPGAGEVVARLVGTSVATLASLDRNAPLKGTERWLADARPDAHGRVRFPYVAAGRHRLQAFGEDAQDVERDVDVGAGRSVDLGEIRRTPFPVVAARVTWPAGSRPPTRIALVQLDVPEGPLRLRTGRVEPQDDRTWRVRGLPAGEHCVRIDAPGFAPQETSVSVREGARPIEIELRAP